jgi:hypothetical protein
MNPDIQGSNFYSGAKNWLLDQGHEKEIEWQAHQQPDDITESEFLREAAWVVYCSGFREATVRRYFDFISMCFCDWASAEEIVAVRDVCVSSAMCAIANQLKHEAVAKIAQRVAESQFSSFKRDFLYSPLATFRTLPFLGPITSVHLAKNLGFDVAKADRHLVRLKDRFGFESVEEMCRSISASSGDAVRVVDLVLWRYVERAGHY